MKRNLLGRAIGSKYARKTMIWKWVCSYRYIMNINHENKQLIFPEVIACMALFAASLLMLDIKFPMNQMGHPVNQPHRHNHHPQ